MKHICSPTTPWLLRYVRILGNWGLTFFQPLLMCRTNPPDIILKMYTRVKEIIILTLIVHIANSKTVSYETVRFLR